MVSIQQIRTRLENGCDKELCQTPDILVCGEEGLFENTKIYCDSCVAKLALLNELEPLVTERKQVVCDKCHKLMDYTPELEIWNCKKCRKMAMYTLKHFDRPIGVLSSKEGGAS